MYQIKNQTGAILNSQQIQDLSAEHQHLLQKKRLTALCSVKKIRGVCTLYVTVKETTRGSSGKHYTYMCKRIKLRTPKIIKDVNGNELYKVEYESVCKAHKGGVKVAKGVVCKKTSGVISKKTKLKRRLKGGDVFDTVSSAVNLMKKTAHKGVEVVGDTTKKLGYGEKVCLHQVKMKNNQYNHQNNQHN